MKHINTYNENISNEEDDYIKIIEDKMKGEFYWDNPSAAIEDIKYLIKLIRKKK